MMTPPVLLQLPQDLATAYNFGGVMVHCLFQLLIEHKLSENNWILATVKGCTKVMHTNLQLCIPTNSGVVSKFISNTLAV